MANVVNNTPGTGQYTAVQLAQLAQDPKGYIWYWCNRNPTAVYNWIRQYYPSFGAVVNGLQKTDMYQQNMFTYLATQYGSLPASQQAHWLYSLGASMPDAPELLNWTTPSMSSTQSLSN